MITNGMAYLKERFIDYDTEIKKKGLVFDTFTRPKANLENSGKTEIEILAQHFQEHLFSYTEIS